MLDTTAGTLGSWQTLESLRRNEMGVGFGGKALPDFVALVLVANGQKIQQNFVEVAQSEVNAHNCYCVTRGLLRTRNRDR